MRKDRGKTLPNSALRFPFESTLFAKENNEIYQTTDRKKESRTPTRLMQKDKRGFQRRKSKKRKEKKREGIQSFGIQETRW